MRNMSFALTTPQVLAQTKDVTRRLGWLHLKAGELFQPVEKGMGLKRGEKVRKLGNPVRVLSAEPQPLFQLLQLDQIGWLETRREGFPDMPPTDFIAFFCQTHKQCWPSTTVTRIEFSYDLLDGWLPMTTAPKDGTVIEILMRHNNWHYAAGVDKARWQEVVRAQWIDFNHGGWTWRGIAGTPVVWRAAL